ncbi:hypothetical protein WJ94_15800 [Burkholderia ubonensis]|uniref:hypothetical protein n=1 Tax=Burkholderia ubonensis TaxID=101571 RepID=UPI000751BF5E|nr:hypothetical protein [Burkholderia ubonensis]KVP76877.1 hypothetical protein WJ94_15800 [Burkholderia ubonensis]
MTERPILFSGPMVRAILDGRKTQTRRVLNKHMVAFIDTYEFDIRHLIPQCPYGRVGDHLWVRELYVAFGRWETRFSEKKGRDEWHFVDMTLDTGREYRFDGALPNSARGGVTPTWWKRPSIFMPRAAARTLLEVTGVRVERLQAITWQDAIAEGIHDPRRAARRVDPVEGTVAQFRHLWDNLNAERGHGWAANPWVWVIEFRRIEQ